LAFPGKQSDIELQKLMNSVPVIMPNTTLVMANYNILDAFENGLYYINEIKQIYKPDRNRYVTWYDEEQGVLSDSFRKEFMDFLFEIDNKKTVNEINPKIDINFLEYTQITSMIYFK
jgi:hypothetical protein